MQAVSDGNTVLLLSDAGMPTISDPGYVAASAVADADLPVTVIPRSLGGIDCARALGTAHRTIHF